MLDQRDRWTLDLWPEYPCARVPANGYGSRGKRQDLPREFVLQEFDVDLDVGYFRRRRGCAAGRIAGQVLPSGYRQIRVAGFNYYAHVLMWLVAHGEWPPLDLEVDHKDGNRDNNAIENLQLLTPRENIVAGYERRRRLAVPA